MSICPSPAGTVILYQFRLAPVPLRLVTATSLAKTGTGLTVRTAVELVAGGAIPLLATTEKLAPSVRAGLQIVNSLEVEPLTVAPLAVMPSTKGAPLRYH